MNGVPVHWVSRKQTEYTAYSSAMAEIYALSETVRDSRLLAFRAEEMGLVVKHPLRIQVDNKASIAFQHNTCMHSKIRGCIDLRAEWVKELRREKNVETVKVGSTQNFADILTKCFPTSKFKDKVRQIRGHHVETARIRAFIAQMVLVQDDGE